MNNLYRELDQGDKQNTLEKQSKFDLYRGKNGNALNTSSRNQVLPQVQRQYVPADQAQKRYSAKDLTDNQGDGSLWAGQGSKSYLFTNQKNRRPGDIVLINIMAKFRKEISLELARMFPQSQTPTLATPQKGAPPTPAPTAAPDPAEDEAPSSAVHDRVSGIIVEEINSDHFLIKGRKNLLYKQKKRTIEIQALVFKKDINDNDEVDSDNFLESTIQVLR